MRDTHVPFSPVYHIGNADASLLPNLYTSGENLTVRPRACGLWQPFAAGASADSGSAHGVSPAAGAPAAISPAEPAAIAGHLLGLAAAAAIRAAGRGSKAFGTEELLLTFGEGVLAGTIGTCERGIRH